MLQRLLSLDDDELYGDGLWSRNELEAMNDRFVAAVERAFELGLESRAAAAGATVRVGALRSGREAAIESAIQAGWDLLCCKKGDISFLEIVAYVRERYPGIDRDRVRAEFARRFKQGQRFQDD